MKLKDFFLPSYRVMPVYQNYGCVGFTVQVKYWWTGLWFTTLLPAAGRNGYDEDCIKQRVSFFKTKEEALDYVKFRQTIL